MTTILLIEDDNRVADFLDRGLRAEGYDVQCARLGQQGIVMARALNGQPHDTRHGCIILLDVMLPDISGFDVCHTLRADQINLPILMLTALGDLEDRVSGLRLGADDYLVKPFAFEELLARIEALLRRGRHVNVTTSQQLVVEDLVLDRSSMQVTRAGKLILLTPRELALLELLMSAPSRLFSRERILANVWGVNEDPMTNIVDVYIRRLRSKIDDGHAFPLIHTQRGSGYRIARVDVA
jgi:DNA-binding response OmpR family regulator